MCLKAAGCMVNSVDPDRTPRSRLLKPICSNAYFNAFVGKPFFFFFSQNSKSCNCANALIDYGFRCSHIFQYLRCGSNILVPTPKKKRNTAKWQTKLKMNLKMMPYIFKTDLVCKLGCKSTIVSLSKLFIPQYKVQ